MINSKMSKLKLLSLLSILTLPAVTAQSVTGSGAFDFLILLVISAGGFFLIFKLVKALK